MLIDNFFPTFNFNEVHGITTIATPDKVFQAIKDVTPEEVAALRPLFAIRALPAMLTGKHMTTVHDNRPLLQQMIDRDFVLLGETSGQELVIGIIGQFWQPSAPVLKVQDAGEFLATDDKAHAKAAMNFYIYRRHGITKIRTETRISIPDTATRRKFGLYWTLISPGSALLRIMWLRAIKRRAERQ